MAFSTVRGSIMSLLPILLAVITSIQVNATIVFPEHAKNGKLWEMIQAENQQLFRLAPAPAQWFTQEIDHFAASSDRHTEITTFQQRFYVVDTFWKNPTGPVILYIGGEGELKDAPSGFVQVLAQKFGAKILALEHRFYGKSVPNDSLSTENLKYLTVQQALADLKAFKDAYQQTMPQQNNKWIAIGGSYPGALSAWFRIAYPDTTVASLSSSGVVNPVYKFHEFDEQVALSAGEKCASALRATTAAFEDEIRAGNGTAVKALLGAEDLCDADFFYMIADSAAMAVQYGHKNIVCDHMVEAYEKNLSLPEQFAKFTIEMYGKSFGSGCFYDTACLQYYPDRWPEGRSWRWQKCSQLAYFQIAPEKNSLRSSIVNLNYHLEQCEAIFGDVVNPSKGVEEITELYGGAYPAGHKIFFSNGGDDPWQRASVVKSISDDEVANLAVCDLCGHCGDLGANPDVPAPLKKQREEIIEYLAKWLNETVDEHQLPTQQEYTITATTSVENKYQSSPLVLVPILFAFIVLVVVLHADIVRDSPTPSRFSYQRLVQT